MSYERFKEVHIATSKWEGGYVDHPQDPGGKTKYGITQKVWRAWCREQGIKAIPVKDIKYEDALAIYYEWYWQAARCDTLQPGVDRMVYDAAVNSGVGRARQWLMASIGGSDKRTIDNYYSKRMDFLRGLSTWKTFGKGWTNRNKDIYAKALADERSLPKLRDMAAVEEEAALEALKRKKAEAKVEKAKTVLEEVAAEDRISKTKTGLGVGGTVVALQTANEVGKAVKESSDNMNDLLASLTLPTIVIVVVAVVIFVIWRDRSKKQANAKKVLDE